MKPTLVALVLLAVLILSPNLLTQAAESSRTFPETGRTVAEPFLSYWLSHGGLAQQGYPITDAYDERSDTDGKTYRTQYFERARFEYHPEVADPQSQILLGLLGREVLVARYPSGKVEATAETVPGGGSQSFAQTGYNVTGAFLTYWQTHGGLAQQGLPITPAFYETNQADSKRYLIQYFERARFEYHPEVVDPIFQVLLGLVGQEVYQQRSSGAATATAQAQATATPPAAAATTAPAATAAPPPAAASPTVTGAAAGCKFTVYQTFQFVIKNNPGLIERLGCPIDRGFDNKDTTQSGSQEFSKATLVLLDSNAAEVRSVYGIFGRSFRRAGYAGTEGGNDPSGAGPHFRGAVRNLGGVSKVGTAVRGEVWGGDGAIQKFEHGILGYVGDRYQLCYAFFPETDTNPDYGTAFEYATR